jgi:molybdenum cofactor cytidylyltransferase
MATEPCCVLVDVDFLRQINCTGSTVIATQPNFSYASVEQRVAVVKSAPFAVARSDLNALVAMIAERGPILQARPIRHPSVAVLYCDPVSGERARVLFDNIMRQRLEQFGASINYSLAVVEEEAAVATALEQLVSCRPSMILVASTTAPACPEDVVGRALNRAKCHLERFMAPVEPGDLLLLAYKNRIPMVCAPGCYRSTKRNVVDLLLPPLLARYPISGWEVACLGHGGLLG